MMGKKILFVEGLDDEHVLKHICGNRGGPHLEFKRLDGIDKLLESYPLELKAGGADDIFGAVIDADTDLAGRWRSLRDRLIGVGYTPSDVPTEPMPGGTIVTHPAGTLLPRAGIWLMPDNTTMGILEDFLRFLVPAGSALFDHVETSVSSIPEGEIRFTELARPKAVIHTWLAWQEEPGKPLGTAITAKFLDPHVHEVDVLVAWLNELFLN